jgi:hypothetical protein
LSQQNIKTVFGDQSFWILLLSNIAAGFFALNEGWSLYELMLVYWIQSVIIGASNFVRILSLKEFSTKSLRVSGRERPEPTLKLKVSMALFFLVHYGFFHLVYFVFLSLNKHPATNYASILIVSLCFLISHLFSFLFNRSQDNKRATIGNIMFFPYIRIIPMHLTIIFGLLSGRFATLWFIALKTFADVIMHVVEHRILRKKSAG